MYKCPKCGHEQEAVGACANQNPVCDGQVTEADKVEVAAPAPAPEEKPVV